MTERSKEEYEKKLQAVGNKLKSLRYTLRSTMGLQERPYRERFLETLNTRQLQQNPSGILPPSGRQPQIQERFQRPRFLDMIFTGGEQPQQQPESQLSETEALLIDEHRKQLLEKAETRLKEEAEENARKEKAESLRQARLKMSVNQN